MKGSTEACSNAEVEIMKKLREAYENDVVAVNVSSALPLCLPRCSGRAETQRSVCYKGGASPITVLSSSTSHTFLHVLPFTATGQPDPRTEPQRFGHLLHGAVHAAIHPRGPRGCSCHPLPPLCSKCEMILVPGAAGMGWTL